MVIEILMPALSPTMTAGNLTKWCKKIGDKVKKGEAILTIHNHANQQNISEKMIKIFQKEIIHITSKKVRPNKLIIEKIS